MRCDDQLSAGTSRGRSELTVNGILENHVQVRIRFVQQENGARPCVQHREQHQYLLKSAACAGYIEPGAIRDASVLRHDMSTSIVGRLELVAEQPPY